MVSEPSFDRIALVVREERCCDRTVNPCLQCSQLMFVHLLSAQHLRRLPLLLCLVPLRV